VVVAIVALIILMVRRCVVGGELGGNAKGRTISAVALTSLWLVYIVLSIFQSYNVGGIGESGWGIDLTKVNPNSLCIKKLVKA